MNLNQRLLFFVSVSFFTVAFFTFAFFMFARYSQQNNIAIASGSDNSETMLHWMDVYNSATGTISLVPKTMSIGRMTAITTILSNNALLIAGGQGRGAVNHPSVAHDGASQKAAKTENTNPNSDEMNDSKSAEFTLIKGPISKDREAHAATLLKNGAVRLW